MEKKVEYKHDKYTKQLYDYKWQSLRPAYIL
jgi:hypothetical protein